MKLMPPCSMIVFAVVGISARLFRYSMFLLYSYLFWRKGKFIGDSDSNYPLTWTDLEENCLTRLLTIEFLWRELTTSPPDLANWK